MDYYDELGLTASATDLDIKKAYRKLALMYHPDKDPTEDAALIFKRVAEAYDVLSDAKLKATFDLLGEEGLKRGVPDGKGGVRGGIYAFEVSPISVFETFFGTSNPYAALMDISAAFGALAEDDRAELGKQRTYDVGLTLEELHAGCQKTVRHVRRIQRDDGGDVEEEERALTLAVPPGCENGRRFVFEGEGNQRPGMEPGPVVYVAAALKHPIFTRTGDHLVYAAKIPLIDSLCGATLRIPTLDGRHLSLPVTEIVNTGDRKIVKGEGMPRADGQGKGDLVIVFDVLFPRTLTPAQKALMRASFFFPGKNPPATAHAAQVAFLNAANHGTHGWTLGYSK